MIYDISYDGGTTASTAYSLLSSDNYSTTSASNCYTRTNVDWYLEKTIYNTTSATSDTWATYNLADKIRLKYAGWALDDVSWYVVEGGQKTPRLSPSEKLREIIQARQAPMVLGTRRALRGPADIKEVRARETLLRVLGEEKYRGFVRNGFVSVRGKSGKVYQIFPGHDFTKVYQRGVLIERLCVVLSGSFPPTDSVIMRYLLILNDEEEFRRMANKHAVTQQTQAAKKSVDFRPLPEILKEFRQKVGMAA